MKEVIEKTVRLKDLELALEEKGFLKSGPKVKVSEPPYPISTENLRENATIAFLSINKDVVDRITLFDGDVFFCEDDTIYPMCELYHNPLRELYNNLPEYK